VQWVVVEEDPAVGRLHISPDDPIDVRNVVARWKARMKSILREPQSPPASPDE
jgi:hypothetical protein